MKGNFLRLLAVLLSGITILLAVFVAAVAIITYRTDHKRTEAFRRDFPSGDKTLVINHVGEPIFPYGPDRMEVCVIEGRRTIYDTIVPVENDGIRGRFNVEWDEDGKPRVTLSGDEMDDIVILPE